MCTKKMQFRSLGVVTTLTAILALAYLSVPVDVAKANGGGNTLVVDVVVDVSTFVGAGSPFHVQGPFYPAGTFQSEGCAPAVDPIGFYHCWGHIPATGGPGVVSQEFEFFGRGKIQVQGQEGPGATIAVVGGTGDFRNVRGERHWVSQALCPGSPSPGMPGATLHLSVEFDLIGARDDGDDDED